MVHKFFSYGEYPLEKCYGVTSLRKYDVIYFPFFSIRCDNINRINLNFFLEEVKMIVVFLVGKVGFERPYTTVSNQDNFNCKGL